ncbi:MAG: HYR domain-containing protein [Saprospiraceae bacterium]|nr:HYR domain-containing protein [Saprospiraceae bacterium]HMW39424.1 HYR domain-containing protein [Saprospiraceae bacterium]HMX89506.1 HYR domain-containing protein [Saprospiraceae bacterium]HMZ41343.1 HYR domain-containing protein [Saprospiraceae bacterium]HNA64062.1 HYR domain-containing protein [Saprospiraceae bacterium]
MKKLLPQSLLRTTLTMMLGALMLTLHAQPRSRFWSLMTFLHQNACNSNPIITCPPDFVACPSASLNPSNTGFATGAPGGPNCSPPVMSYHDDTISVGPCSGAIELRRTWTATDPQNPNLTSSCLQKIILSDKESPQLNNCPGSIDVKAGSDCKAHVTWSAPTVTDNCGKLFLTVTHISGDAFPIGVTTVTYLAEDLCGNTSSCAFSITVSGTCCKTKPKIQCPADFSGCPGDSLNEEHTGKPIVVQGDSSCNQPSISYRDSVLSKGPCPGALNLIRIWKAADPYDSTLFSSCTQHIEFKDQIAPSITGMPSNITVNPSVDCKAMVIWTPPVSTDNCGKVKLTSNFVPGSLFSEGVNTITYTASDDCGNFVTASFLITVTPCCHNQPLIQCPLNFTGCPGTSTEPLVTGTAIATKPNPGCGTPVVSYTDSVVNYTCPGSKMLFRKWKATDPNDSNLVAYCVQLIELKDVTPPVFNACPANITVNTNTIDCKAVVIWTPPAVSDNCGHVQLTSNFAPGYAFPVGTTTVNYTAQDDCGNTIQHIFTITVVNTCCNTKPKIICPPDYKGCPTEQCGTNISGTATAEPGAPGCPQPILSFRDSLLNIYSYCLNAKKFIRIWRATDPNDPKNFVECNQLIDLIDKTPPVWSYCPPDITVQANGECEKAVTWIPPTATDNCGGMVQITSNYVPGQKFPAGTTVVVYTAKDPCGNSINHSFRITVLGAGLQIDCPQDIVVERTDPYLPGAYVNWSHPKVTTCGSCQDSLKGFIYMGTWNGSKYYCSKTTETWTAARAICSSLGGYLCVINSADENTFVASKLMGGTAYIGLHDSNIEGFFEWVDQSSVNYTNWYAGQPNNANGDQDFVEMLPDGTWNDQYANTYREFICEIPCYTISQIEGPPCGSLFKCGTTKITYVATQGQYTDTCSFNVTVKCNNSKYCESRAQNCGFMWIKNVSLANINNTTGSSGGYAYYPTPCGELKWGKTYDLCLTPGFSNNVYTVYWKVWIDYNADGDFLDADEFVAYGYGNGTLCGTITLPWNCQCTMTNTRMRVSMAYGGYPGNSCCIFSYGEVEDYCININKNTLVPDVTSLLRISLDAVSLNGHADPNVLLDQEPLTRLFPEPSIELIPNPASEIVQVNVISAEKAMLRIYTADGLQVYETAVTQSSYLLNVSEWSNGLYFVTLEDSHNSKVVSKLSVMH